MPPLFGTSGLRGLVDELTPDLVFDVVRAYLSCCSHNGGVIVAWDLRPSSPAIAETVLNAISAAGLQPIRAGAVPTPALALAASAGNCGAIMVTGSHIPADRNGLKFYTTKGEITKKDEQAILAALGNDWPLAAARPAIRDAADIGAAYVDRYIGAFGPDALAGFRIGIYQHSSVARDLMIDIFARLGAVPIALGRSDHFIPVDTEAVAPDTKTRLCNWCGEHGLDALVSTDGDADRPLLCDATGQLIAGDILGVLTARAIGASAVCTPVSSNSMVDMLDNFTVHRTAIGSPYVIAAMDQALAVDPMSKVVGYEANGGFLLGFTAVGPKGSLTPLITRDCMLPLIAPLVAAHSKGQRVAELLYDLPQRFTATDRIQDVSTAATKTLIDRLSHHKADRAAFFNPMLIEKSVDLTDGLRVNFTNGSIIHLRPSGNAPECRCYTEAGSTIEAKQLLVFHLEKLRQTLAVIDTDTTK